MSSSLTTSFQFNRTSGLITPCRFARSPNCDARPESAKIDVIVIHCISLPPHCYGGDFIEQFFTNRLDSTAHTYFKEIATLKVSAHFLIKRNGELIQFVPTVLRAWHAGVSTFHHRKEVNDFSIGVELEGCEEQPFADAQYTVLSNLVVRLMDAYPAITKQHIVGHSDIANGRKTDPGPYFDWQRFREPITTSDSDI